MQKDSCGLMIKKIHEAVRKRVDNSLREKDLTLTQIHVLMVLGGEGGEAKSLKELERRFQVAQSTIVGIIGRLETKGFVQGFTAPDDNRVKLVKLTPEGERFREANIKEVEEMEQRLLSNLTNEEKEEFLRMLLLVYDSVSAESH